MKTIFKSLLVAVTLTTFSFSGAQADLNKPVSRHKKVVAFQTGMYTTVEGKLQIAVDKEMGGRVVVRLLNAAGKEMFVEPIAKHQQAFRLRLDVSNLPDGEYQVEVSNGVDVQSQAVTLVSQKPTASVRVIAVQ